MFPARKAGDGSEAIARRGSQRFDLVFHPVTLAFDDDSFRVMEEAVEHSAGQRCVVVEELGPAFVGLIGRQHDGAPLVTLADDLEQQVGARLVDGQIADLVNDQHRRREEFF